jgi:uncharacterized membrane protein (DUF485 family)
MESTESLPSPSVKVTSSEPRAARPANRTAREVVASPEFRALVRRRWAVSTTLLVLLFVAYYGYILLIAVDKPFVAQSIDGATTLAIPLGVGVIVIAWLLTAFYVAWANKSYDPEVERLKGQLRH